MTTDHAMGDRYDGRIAYDLDLFEEGSIASQ